MDELRGAIGLVQVKKFPDIIRRMRNRQIHLRRVLDDIPRIRLRRLIDEGGDSGAYLIWFHEDKETAERFVETIRAEGIPVSPPPGGIHQYRHMSNLLKNMPVTTAGCPWTCPFNQGSPMEYHAGMLPRSNDLLDRARMISLPPQMTDQDEEDLIRAFKKVAAALLQ